MDNTLTVRDLLLPGEPLDPAEVVAGRDRLNNPVSWVASLRPYPPAFPRLRGGELALVATEHLARLEPPATLGDVVRQLASRNAAGVAVRGDIDEAGRLAAEEAGLPLLRLAPDAPLHDIEQAIMRACALYQARREIMPAEDASSWIRELLAGRIATVAEAQAGARKQGVRLASHYAVAYVRDQGQVASVEELAALLRKENEKPNGAGALVQAWEGGLAALLPAGSWDRVEGAIAASGLSCGVGGEKPLLDAPASLAEAQLAAMASGLLYGGKPLRYADMGADKLLMALHRDQPEELRRFVDETLGPLLRHDEGSPTPVLPTLRSFIEHGGRLRETAAHIYVHRNTLAYRLDRAAEILGVDLKDPQARLAIELALKALPLVEVGSR